MNKIKNKIIASLLVCFILIPNIDSKALFLVSDIKVAPEISFGNNAAFLLKNEKIEINGLNSKNDKSLNTKIKTNFPFHFGIMFGYKLWFFEPEIGFKYPSKQYLELGDFFKYEEQFFEIPIRFNFIWSIIPSMFGLKFITGYKINIPLSGKFTVTTDNNLIQKLKDNYGVDSKMLESIDNIKEVSNFPSGSGNIILGFGLDLPFGMYINSLVSIPTEIFSIVSEADKNKTSKEKSPNPADPIFIKGIRSITVAFYELQFGVDIMKIIF